MHAKSTLYNARKKSRVWGEIKKKCDNALCGSSARHPCIGSLQPKRDTEGRFALLCDGSRPSAAAGWRSEVRQRACSIPARSCSSGGLNEEGSSTCRPWSVMGRARGATHGELDGGGMVANGTAGNWKIAQKAKKNSIRLKQMIIL